MELLHLTTADNKKIVANYFPLERKKQSSRLGWIVFLHMMPATKESWTGLANQLQQEGYVGLAIDLRGHGHSEDGPHGFTQFSDHEHQDSVRDIDAAVDFLKGVGARPEHIYFIGASIGANLALQYIKNHRVFKKAVLFSPGFDYHGIDARSIVSALPEDKHLLYIAADDDRAGENSKEVNALYERTPCTHKQKEIMESGGHGTALLLHHPELIQQITSFFTHE